jgi:transposase InsO family protein
MCRVLGASRSGYYAWKRRKPSVRVQANGQLLEHIRDVHQRSRRTYGSPRIHAELREMGVACGVHRVARIMRENGIEAKTVRLFRKKAHSGEYYREGGNLLAGRRPPRRTNEVWVADMTYIKTGEGWFYLAAIMDLYSRKIVGWSMDQVRDSLMALRAFNQAWQNRGQPKGMLFHSDQGIEWHNNTFKQHLRARRVVQSNSEKGHCYDNAHMESFFHTLKTELVYLERLETRALARQKIFDYMEIFYNRQRRHSSLGYQSPEHYEKVNKLN